MDTRAANSPASTRSVRPKPPSRPPATSNVSQSDNQTRQQNGASRQSNAAGPSAKAAKAAASRSETRPAQRDTELDRRTASPVREASPAVQKALQPKANTPQPPKVDPALQMLKTDFDSVRTLLSCKICARPLYEPFVIACGHTYCYSCLCQWFSSHKAKKTCPDCRAVVTQPPAPAYLIREMTVMLTSKPEHLVAGDTLEQHAQWRKEEAEIVQQDRNNTDPHTGGLFKGLFKHNTDGPLRAIRDEEDGVDRCPVCAWELEDGECTGCGLQFDDDRNLTWTEGFSGFSDMDETSERDHSGEDYDAEFDMDDQGAFDGYDYDDYDDEHRFAIHQWLANGNLPPPLHRPMRAAHSAAGSRRRSYSASIVSGVDTNMDILEEEEEEDEEDGDSSMNDFIVDDEQSRGASNSTRSASHTPQPASGGWSQRRNRRVIDSGSSSNASNVAEDDAEDDDDDEEGPVPNGRRRQQSQLSSQDRSRTLASSIASRSSRSASTELEEDEEALLPSGYSPLSAGGPDDEMGEEGYESEGGRTTVGWDANAQSTDRSRTGGSLTPTADRPNPLRRPPSRTGGSRRPDGSRGLRRRSSVLSTMSMDHYEDGEADDDDSEVDRDGDTAMNEVAVLRNQSSRARLRNAASATAAARVPPRGFTPSDPINLDEDDGSDTSVAPSRRGNRPRTRQPDYDPRISLMFAQHLTNMRELNSDDPHAILGMLDRSTTPIARPRTANRNRPPSQSSTIPPFSPLSNGPMPPFSPLAHPSPARHRSNPSESSVRSERSNAAPNVSASSSASTNGGVPLTREGSVDSSGSSSTATALQYTPAGSENGLDSMVAAAHRDVIDRPMSRVSSRPPSAAGRRSSAGLDGAYQGLTMSPGFNIASRAWQTQTRNPWSPFVPPPIRQQPSTRRLRNEASTRTLRAAGSTRTLRQQTSRINVQDAAPYSPNMRTQPSRQALRSPPSHYRLQPQPSNRALRVNDVALAHVPLLSATQAPAVTARPQPAQTTGAMDDERQRRIEELLRQRQEAIGVNPLAANTNNPFLGRRRQGSVQSQEAFATNPAQQHSRQSSVISAGSLQQPIQLQGPAQPTLGRRRSMRNVGVPPPGVLLSPTQHHAVPARARSGQNPGSPGYEAQFSLARGVSPMISSGESVR